MTKPQAKPMTCPGIYRPNDPHCINCRVFICPSLRNETPEQTIALAIDNFAEHFIPAN